MLLRSDSAATPSLQGSSPLLGDYGVNVCTPLGIGVQLVVSTA